MDMLLDGIITRDDFERQKLRLRDQQIDIETQMQSCREGDDSFKESMLFLLDIASEAHGIFTGSTIDEKRQLLNFVFANLKLNGTTLCYSLKKPFDQFIKCTDRQEWRPRQDSNL
jgi:site-specific DNA recombinase